MKKTTALLFLVLLIPAAAFAQSVNVRKPVAVGETPQTIKMLQQAIESGVKQADASGLDSARIETWIRREGRFFHVKMVISSSDDETSSQKRYLVEEAEGRLVQQTKALVLSFSAQRAEALAEAEAAKEAERKRIAAEKAAEEERKKRIAEEKAAEAKEFLDRWVHGEVGVGALDALDALDAFGGFADIDIGLGGSLKLGLLFYDKYDAGFYFGLRPEIALYHTGIMSVSLPRISFGWFFERGEVWWDLTGFYLSPLYSFHPDSPESGFWGVEIGWNGLAGYIEGPGGKLLHRFSAAVVSAVVVPGEGVTAKGSLFQYSLVF